jgi:heat shock protein HtpX
MEGVLAHELSHVKNQDTLIGAIAATLAGAITILARFASYAFYFGAGGRSDEDRGSNPVALLLMAVLAPLAATIIQLAISRSREYEADRTGAEITGNPQGLARALGKIDKWAKRIPMQASPSMAHLFIYQPLTTGEIFSSLFSTALKGQSSMQSKQPLQ